MSSLHDRWIILAFMKRWNLGNIEALENDLWSWADVHKKWLQKPDSNYFIIIIFFCFFFVSKLDLKYIFCWFWFGLWTMPGSAQGLFTPGSALRNYSLWAEKPYRVLGIKPKPPVCKANTLYYGFISKS